MNLKIIFNIIHKAEEGKRPSEILCQAVFSACYKMIKSSTIHRNNLFFFFFSLFLAKTIYMWSMAKSINNLYMQAAFLFNNSPTAPAAPVDLIKHTDRTQLIFLASGHQLRLIYNM